MADKNPVDIVNWKRVACMCGLSACDVHIMADTLWLERPSADVIAGLLIGAYAYECAVNPCIIDINSPRNAVWYGGVINDTDTPIIWLVHMACERAPYVRGKMYTQLPFLPQKLTRFDARALEVGLRKWIPNSMASACLKAKAMNWIQKQPVIHDTDAGWIYSTDLSKTPLLTLDTPQE